MSEDEAPVPPAGPAPLTPELAAMAVGFLTRPGMGVTLHATEVEAFLRVRVALEAIAMSDKS